MKKIKLFFFILSFCLTNKAEAQNWESLGIGVNSIVRSVYADTSENKVYVGRYTMSSGINTLSVWDGANWDSLDNIDYNIYSIKKFQGNIIVANGDISKWDGSNWIVFGQGAVGLYNHNDNNLYAVGGFDTIGGVAASRVAKWDGSTWSAIDTTHWIGGLINCAIIFQDHLYIGGNFWDQANTISRIARWDSTHWESLGAGILGSSFVSSFEIYNNELYVGGYFTTANGNPGDNIARWDGNQWHDVGGGMPDPSAINDLKTFDGSLYAVGSYYTAGGVPAMNIAKWDGTNWCGLGYFGSGVAGGNIRAIDASENELYIGGSFTEINGDLMNHVSKWIGGSYTDTCSNLSIGINEYAANDLITLFPNPTQSTLTIQFSEATKQTTTLQIKSMLGQTVKMLQLASGEKQLEIDVSALSNGLYFLQYQSGNQLISKKFVKQ